MYVCVCILNEHRCVRYSKIHAQYVAAESHWTKYNIKFKHIMPIFKKPIRLSLPCNWKQAVTLHEDNHSPYLSRIMSVSCQSQWPRGLKHGSATARMLRLWVRILPGAKMFVYCECCVLSSRGLCDELIARQEESYRPWCVVECDLETSWMRRP